VKRQTKKTKATRERLVAAGWSVVLATADSEWWVSPDVTRADKATKKPWEYGVRFATARERLDRVPCPNFGMTLDGPESYRCGCVRKRGHRGRCRCKHGEELPKF
jgi:hypothetical protein